MCGHGGYYQHQDCGCGGHHQQHQDCGCSEGHHQHYDCGCGKGHQEHHGHRHGDWVRQGASCCCQPGHGVHYGGHASAWGRERVFWRRFSTREERIAWLEKYLEELRAEAQAVEERIAELKAE